MVKKSFKYNNFVAYNRKKIWVKYSCTHANNHAFKKWKKIKTLSFLKKVQLSILLLVEFEQLAFYAKMHNWSFVNTLITKDILENDHNSVH